MFTSLIKQLKLLRFVSLLVVAGLLYTPLSVLAPESAKAEDIFYHNDGIEDPELKSIVKDLVDIIKVLWVAFWSFKWITHPGAFYQNLKKFFKVWFKTMKALYANLMLKIAELETELANSYKCKDKKCTELGGN